MSAIQLSNATIHCARLPTATHDANIPTSCSFSRQRSGSHTEGKCQAAMNRLVWNPILKEPLEQSSTAKCVVLPARQPRPISFRPRRNRSSAPPHHQTPQLPPSVDASRGVKCCLLETNDIASHHVALAGNLLQGRRSKAHPVRPMLFLAARQSEM
ncbi:uncharacterized protein BKA78DRAFT_57446 [Phyllosticta capitalensis]|uniref:uncharacterized protein n=1 Tax=Phyllosticta capitalensis TaxID=121624 RepID=UPI0031319FB3